MTRRKKKMHRTEDDCIVIPRAEFVGALAEWCEAHGDRPVTARGIDKMLGIERVRR